LLPPLERGGTFCRLLAKQQSLNTDILVQIRPVDAVKTLTLASVTAAECIPLISQGLLMLTDNVLNVA